MNSNCKYVFRRRPGASGVWAYLLALIGAVGLAASAKAATFEAVSRTLIAAEETCPNNAIDPGETNTVTFVIKNTSGGELKNVKATLANSGNVVFSTSGTINIGTMANNATASVNLRFRAGGSCGGSLTPTVNLTADGGVNVGLAFGAYQLGETITQNFEFSNNTAITINDFAATPADTALGRANPYPSQITVSGVPNANGVTGDRASRITVTLRNLRHSFSKDINALLVAPNGTEILLLREVGGSGGSAGVNNATVTFAANGAAIPVNTQLASGTVAPTTHDGNAFNMPSSATEGPYTGTLNDVVTDRGANNDTVSARNPNGAWKLFIQDDQQGDAGAVEGGWALNITTTRISCCGAGEGFPYIIKNGRPVIDQVEVAEDAANTVVPFSAFDLETAAGDLAISFTSSDETLVKSSEIALEGAADGENRSLKVKKIEANRFGTTVITITARDASNRSSSLSFNFKVNAVNDVPTFPTKVRNQQFNRGVQTVALPFTVADVETAAGDLIVTAESSNDAVVTDNAIVLGGSGANRTISLIPAGSGGGSTTIRVFVSDGTATEFFDFLVNFDADPGDATISPISNTTTEEDKPIDIPITIRSGSATPVDSLILEATSANTTILPVNRITFSGTGTERTVRLNPALNQFGGPFAVRITVKDPNNDPAGNQFTEFNFTVTPVNDKPTVSSVGDRTINEDSNTGDLSFTVGDVETSAGNLTLSGISSDQEIVPNANITFGGSGANRTVKVTPLPNAFGKVTISVVASDRGRLDDGNGPDSTTSQFVLTINGINDDPRISNVENPSGVETALAADTSPVVVSIIEDIETETVDGVSKVKEQTLKLEGITAGLGNETEQTVTIGVALANNNVIESIRVSQPDNAQVKSPTTTATLTYRPKRNAFGTTEVTLTLTDNGDGNRSITRKFKIEVTPVNDQPTIADIPDQPARSKDSPGLSVPLSISDVETAASQFAVTATSSDQNVVMDGNIIVNSQRNLISIIPSGNVGTATITITATDRGALNDTPGGGLSDTETFTVTFDNSPVNNPPTISLVDSAVAVDEDNLASTIVIIADDEDADNVTLSATSSDPNIVSNILFSDLFGVDMDRRNIAIQPNENANGTVTITVIGTDSKGLSSLPRTLVVSIRPVEDNPVLTLRGGLSDGTHTANEDANPIKDGDNNLELSVTDAETTGDNLVVTADTTVGEDVIPDGNIQISPSGSVRTITIRPAANKNGNATVVFTVRDAAGRTNSKTVQFTINSVNDAPTLNSISNITISEDAGTQTLNLSGITAGGGENQTLTPTAVTFENSALIPNPVFDPAYSSPDETATIKFTPAANASGTAKIRVTVTDTGGTDNGGVNTFSREFTVTVNAVNDKPQILSALPDLTANVNEVTGPLTITINDAETPAAQLTLTATSSNSSLVPNTTENLQVTGSGPNRGLLIKPATNVSGVTDITVTVTDGGGETTTDTFRYTVNAGVDPVISSIPNQIVPKNTFSDIIPFTVTDAQSPSSSLTVTVTSDNTSVLPAGNISFSSETGANRAFIIRSGNNSGSANITFRVVDPQGNDSTSTFKVTVQGATPTITAIADQTLALNGTTGALPFTISDGLETPPGFLNLTVASSDTTFAPLSRIFLGGTVNNGQRTITVSPATGRTGSSLITLTVTDQEGLSATETFTVRIEGAANQAPTISSIPNQTIDQGASTPVINFTVGDAETAAGSLTVTASAGNSTLVPESGIFLGGTGANRTLLITPAATQSGSTTITVTVRDGSGSPNATASTTFTLTVRAPEPNNNITDLNGDGKTDLVFQTHDGFLAIWTVENNLVRTSAAFINPNNVGDTRWRVFGSGDFNSDGHADLAFQHDDGTLAVWIMNRLNFVRGELINPGNPGPGWRAVATVDFNRDNKMDILLQHADGTAGVWYLDGLNRLGAQGMVPSNTGNSSWKLVAGGRVDGDAQVDLIWQHDDGTIAAWLMSGNTMVAPALFSPSTAGADFRIVSAFNLDNQNSVDLLFHSADGTLAAWYMSGFDLINAEFSTPTNAGATWRVVAP